MSQAIKPLRFILVNVVPSEMHTDAALFDLEELKSLVLTFGGATIVRVIQRRNNPDPGTYIGSGKADEIAEMIKSEKIDVVVLNTISRPGQIFRLEKLFWPVNPVIKVWDRIDLILHIFSKHAQTAEAKLQIELARMRHMGPRMYGLGGTYFSRQGAGIGTKGLGETNVELMKRHWRSEMKHTTDQLKKLTDEGSRRLERRREIGYQTVSIVGYTNAGKTSLFNRLTGKKKLTENALFATLDSSIGKMYVPKLKGDVLISDTIGFIQNLPPSLINAFKSTLMESIHADLLLHVIDIADPLKYEKIQVVEMILKDLEINHKKKIYVFNKVDLIEPKVQTTLSQSYVDYHPQFISVTKDTGIKELQTAIESSI